MTKGAMLQFHTQGLPWQGCLSLSRGLGNLVVEWAGCYVTFNECRATPYLVPPWDCSGAQPTSDTKLCPPGVREQAREWPASHTAVFMASNIIICMSFPGWP